MAADLPTRHRKAETGVEFADVSWNSGEDKRGQTILSTAHSSPPLDILNTKSRLNLQQ